jgi:hypothetical protein
MGGLTLLELGAGLIGFCTGLAFIVAENTRLPPPSSRYVQMLFHGCHAFVTTAALVVIARGPLLDVVNNTKPAIVCLEVLVLLLGAFAGVSMARFSKPALSMPSKQPTMFV